MRVRPSLIESIAIAGFFAAGIVLRTWHLDREAVEHFDEGVYASVLWHDGTFKAPYPAREFYAPPLLSTLIDGVSVLPGIGRFAPFVPSVILGSLTILALWWLARSWFGRAAGIFIAAVVAMSDFHIVYSRMALTDVPCLFWIVVSVYFGTLAIQKQSFWIAAVSGVACGLAWWTKYTGWLPLAILFSGTALWWTWVGRRSIGAVRAAMLLGTILAAAGLTFLPWWWQLSEVGGYSAVNANHAKYLGDLSGWRRHLADHLAFQFRQDGISGAISLGLGMIAAGLFRWNAAGRFTGNIHASQSGSEAARETAGGRFPPTGLLVRFVIAALALSILSVQVFTPLMLACIALGGFAGMFLWPVQRRAWQRAKAGDASPTADGALPMTEGDLRSAPTIDPALGLCTTLTWFVGMLLVTPLYHPYARLFFPLLASVWLAAAGGVSWWMESNLSVARRVAGGGEPAARRSWAQYLVTGMLAAGVAASFFRFDENREIEIVPATEAFTSLLFADRTSIVPAANEIADLCVLSARDELPSRATPAASDGSIIRPEDVKRRAKPTHAVPGLTTDERRRERVVVYVYGEPALLFHLHEAGVTAVPVSHLNLLEPDGAAPLVPTFIVIGPNAKRAAGFWEQWMERIARFDEIGHVEYRPSEVSLLDLFSPKWRSQHNETEQQIFEVHRVR